MARGFLVRFVKGVASLAMPDGSMMDVPSSRVPKGIKPGMDVEVGKGKRGGASITAIAPPAPTIEGRKKQGPNAQQLKGAAARQQYAMRRIMSHGWSSEQAAGVVGRFMQESYGRLDTTAKGDLEIPGGSVGIGQWNRERKANLIRFAKKAGKPVTDLDTQIDFWNHEIRNAPSERIAFAALEAADTVDESSAAMMHYERPRGYTARNPRGGHGFGNTVKNAAAVLGMFDPSQVINLASAAGSAIESGSWDGTGGGDTSDPGDTDMIIDPFEGEEPGMEEEGPTMGETFASDMAGDGGAADAERSAARHESIAAMMQQGVSAQLEGPLPTRIGDIFGEG